MGSAARLTSLPADPTIRVPGFGKPPPSWASLSVCPFSPGAHTEAKLPLIPRNHPFVTCLLLPHGTEYMKTIHTHYSREMWVSCK